MKRGQLIAAIDDAADVRVFIDYGHVRLSLPVKKGQLKEALMAAFPASRAAETGLKLSRRSATLTWDHDDDPPA